MMNFAGQTVTAIATVIFLVDYLLGVTLGMFGGLVFGSVRENHGMSMLEQAPDSVSAGARVLLMPYTRDDGGYLRSLPPGRRARRGSRGDSSSGTKGQGVNR